ncbi:MAG TPA: hypothetical protein VMF69_22040 [Gemmataceae bacterium]|nr:hypothetical protein [Gemmataceae bacterium]
MPTRLSVVTLTLLVSWGQFAATGRAAVVVLANRTTQEVRFTVAVAEGKSRPYTLPKGELLALPLTSGVEIVFSSGSKQHRCRVRLNEIYYFVGDAATMRLIQVGFGGTWRQPPQARDDKDAGPAGRPAERSQSERGNEDGILLKVPVKIMVDQAEPTVQNIWEKRLRQRVKKASDILEKYCRVRLEVIDVGKWESDDSLTKLPELLRDFREKAALGKARLAIGFTGLRPEKNGDRYLGCTPGPLYSHILIREYKLKSEIERFEVLLHEVGHFLGACHSPEGDSVMRPKLGEGKVNLRAFRIGFDPLNTLAMNLVAEELARRPVHGLRELSAPTRRRLLDILTSLARTTPDDPAAPQFIRMMGATPPETWPVRSLSDEVLDGARAVVTAITAEAKREGRRRKGDELTERYFRVAAAECRRLSPEDAVAAYTLGLAIALDRQALLRFLPLRGINWTKIESEIERRQRLAVLGEPTMQGRASLMQSFVISAAALMLVEGQAISAAGVQEELLFLQGGDRFRFDDLAASLAGIAFATQLDTSPELLGELATSFRVGDYLLSAKGLPDSLNHDEFGRQFGATTDERFLEKQDALRKRLLTLPGYQPRPPRK